MGHLSYNYSDMQAPDVSVIMVTYNQKDYIAEAIESVLAQKTNYYFEIIIGDDRSTDDTAKVCETYRSKHPELINLILQKKNKGLVSNFVDCVHAAKGKYIALCDGDDYWIDPQKLQKQIDFLENNPDCAFVHTHKRMLYNGEIIKQEPKDIPQNIEELLLRNFINVPTAVFRREPALAFTSYFSAKATSRGWMMQDYPIWLFLALDYNFAYLEDETAMYRVLNNTLSRMKNKKRAYLFDKGTLDVKEYFFRKYDDNLPIQRSFKNRFKLMVFHSRKRMLLDYGWIAREQIPSLFKLLPVIIRNFFLR